MRRDIGISVAEFALAIAVQSLSWDLLQPLAGGLAVRWGFRAIMVRGAVRHLAGLMLMATAHLFISIMMGAGVLIGVSLACTSATMAMSVAARVVS